MRQRDGVRHRLIPGAVARCSCGWVAEIENEELLAGYCDADERLPYGQRVKLAAANCWRSLHAAILASTDPAQQLILLADAGGDRHYLAGRPVPYGALLELQLGDGTWMPVRYLWSWKRGEAVRVVFQLGPIERLEVEGVRAVVAEMVLPTEAALRWPMRSPWFTHPCDPPVLRHGSWDESEENPYVIEEE